MAPTRSGCRERKRIPVKPFGTLHHDRRVLMTSNLQRLMMFMTSPGRGLLASLVGTLAQGRSGTFTSSQQGGPAPAAAHVGSGHGSQALQGSARDHPLSLGSGRKHNAPLMRGSERPLPGWPDTGDRCRLVRSLASAGEPPAYLNPASRARTSSAAETASPAIKLSTAASTGMGRSDAAIRISPSGLSTAAKA